MKMSAPVSLTRDGTPWEPLYLDSISIVTCIGCGRCFKVCGQGVLEPAAVNEDGEIVDPDEEESEKTVMVVANQGACIGCKACLRVCTAKGAQTHVAA
jgi:Nif-specific ferredoxin III